ncbi:hypothetical protein F5878DRAFT_705977 [Lentinula raphanica]|uniref:Metal homeostatis protein bsd2 n=1 Tax=Lentinula raphanica TaxID=153919 RepID=A0AA38UKI3_9AGAR|nr:hypothetical protein EV360DRAFT_45616 [Lentinula raphanica]KAJ3829920.1 hypothetical protein F5880DRAFT_144429 [Lentinula raphanica]KAJ3844740.1 hypothetical protein F5878DRAFT_705977 [Lentinula raphanica]
MPARYTAIPSQEEANSRELADAFGPDNEEDEITPLQNHHTPHYHGEIDIEASAGPPPPTPSAPPGAYDFERDYDVPPPGSPPPHPFSRNIGFLPTSPIRRTFDRRPTPSFLRRMMGAVLPTHYSQIPTEDSSESMGPRRYVGGGSDNDGVFANVMAKPAPVSESRIVRDPNGNIHLVPEENQKEPPPSYAAAQADAAPAYWETTVHAPALINGGEGGDGTMLIDDLPSGSVWVFLVNMTISWFFQFVGFLLTFVLHTSHAAKYGSRAGLGLTLIQYGLYSRTAPDGGWNDEGSGDGVEIITTDRTDPPIPTSLFNGTGIIDPTEQEIVPGVSSRDWLSFLLMTVGWFLLLSSTISFWRVKRWESSIRSSTAPNTSSATRSGELSAPGSQFLTREEYEHDVLMRRNLANVFGISFDEEEEQAARDAIIANGGVGTLGGGAVGGAVGSGAGGGLFGWGESTGSVLVDENGHAVIIPGQEALEEARLARDLRAAGLL